MKTQTNTNEKEILINKNIEIKNILLNRGIKVKEIIKRNEYNENDKKFILENQELNKELQLNFARIKVLNGY